MGLRDEQGMMAIGVALMLIVVLSLFGGALWQYSMAEMKRVERTKRDLQALFLARAGAELVLGAWSESTANRKPEGQMDRIYCYPSDLGSYSFSTDRQPDPFGYVDVTVTEIDDDPKRNGLVEIVAVASVNGVSRQAKLVSYPHTTGHNLNWYDQTSGEINYSKNEDIKPKEHSSFVIVRSDQPIHFKPTSNPLDTVVTYSAPLIRFETEINLGLKEDGQRHYIIEPSRHRVLDIVSEVIYLLDLTMLHLGKKSGYGERSYTVTLKLPSEGMDGSGPGVLGQEIGGEKDVRYGKVFFQGSEVGIQEYEWKTGFLNAVIRKITNQVTPIKALVDGEYVNVAGRSFYFKHETDLSNPGDNDLIPIRPDDEDIIDLKDVRAFYWE